MEEAELVRKMISGDKDAFAGLMEIYQKQALRAAYLISGNYADSEDIVQETFTSCYINRKQIRDPEAFKGWFYKTLSRTAWRVCRKARREQPAEEVPVKQRTVIILYYYNEMTIKEIAASCGCLEGTVKSRLFHGKARLKEALTKQDQKGGATWTILS